MADGFKAKAGGDKGRSHKNLILSNFEERTQNLLKALFAVWSGKRSCLSADSFYQKMTTFGLAPDLKFIEQVTNTVYQSRPKQQQFNQATTMKEKTISGANKRALSPENTNTARDSCSGASNIRFESSIRPGESHKGSKGRSPSAKANTQSLANQTIHSG